MPQSRKHHCMISYVWQVILTPRLDITELIALKPWEMKVLEPEMKIETA